MPLPVDLEAFRKEYFPKNLPQAEYKIIYITESPQNNGTFNDERLRFIKEVTQVRVGKEKSALLEKYNPNPGQTMNPQDYELAKESLRDEPFSQKYREHILKLLNPTSYESQASFRYEATASENKPSCEGLKPQGVSNGTWSYTKWLYDDICGDGECPDGVTKDCEGVCDGSKVFDCFGICGGTAQTDDDGNCCEPHEIGCSGKCLSIEGYSWGGSEEECCEEEGECFKCVAEDGTWKLLCPQTEPEGENDEGGQNSGGSGASKVCESMFFPPSNVFEKEQKAVKITFESVPELSGIYTPEKNIANSWILNSGGINIARIQPMKSFGVTCLIHWEFSFKTLNGELVDIDSGESEYDRKMLVLSKHFSVSYPNKILEIFISTADKIRDSRLSEAERLYDIKKLKEYFDFWPDKRNILDFTIENVAARDSITAALNFTANTLTDAYNNEQSKIRAELIDHEYNVPDDDIDSEFCATNLSGGKVAFHWKAPLKHSQTGWKIVVKTTGLDINYTIGAEKCGYTVTRNDSWQRIELRRHYSNDSTNIVKTLEVSEIGSCLESTICPSSSTKSVQKKLSFQWSCNTVYYSTEVVTVDFSIDKDTIEDYIDIKVLSASTEYCDGADNIYFKNVKMLDDSSTLEVDYTNQIEKYKFFKTNNESSTFEVWLRIKHPTIKNGDFQDFITVQPAPTPSETETETETIHQSSSLGNLKFYVMKEDLGHLETCSAGYFILSLKKYNEDSFVQQGTNKIFTSGSGGSNFYDVPFLTLGNEGSEIAIDTGDTIKLRYRAMPPSGNPYLGTGCYSFYKKPNKISIEYGEVEDTGSTTNPVITGWSKSAELDNLSSDAFTDFEYTFSASDGNKLNWCAVMKSTPITDFKVSGGSLTSPYYNFTAQHPYGSEFSFSGTSMKIIPGLTYTFTDDGVSSTHPFTFALYNNGAKLPQDNDYISGGESEGTMYNVLKGGGKTLTVQIPEDYTGEFYYTCYRHSIMNIKVKEETVLDVDLNGYLLDGYIKNATGQLIDLETDTIIRQFVTDSYGKWSVKVPNDELPKLYKIKFLPGGIDILTNKEVKTTFSNVAIKNETTGLSSKTINISPVTTLKAAMVENKIKKIIDEKEAEEEIDLGEVDTIIIDTQTFVAKKFEIPAEDLEKDYINESNTKMLKANAKLSVITETLKDLVTEVEGSVEEDNIFESLVAEFEKTKIEEETSNTDIKVKELIDTKVVDIVKNAVSEEKASSITAESKIITNIKSISEIVIETIDTEIQPTESESEVDFVQEVQNVAKNILSTIEYVKEIATSNDLTDNDIQETKEVMQAAIAEKKEDIEDVDSKFIFKPDPTPTPTYIEPEPEPQFTPTPIPEPEPQFTPTAIPEPEPQFTPTAIPEPEPQFTPTAF